MLVTLDRDPEALVLVIAPDNFVGKDTLGVEDGSLVGEHSDGGADASAKFLASITVHNLVVRKSIVLPIFRFFFHDW